MSGYGQPSNGIFEEAGQPPLVNLALGRPALQSSTDVFSSSPDPALDARGAVSGLVTGGLGFHTGSEDGPWWQVDLGAPSVVHEIVVFNRGDQAVLLDRAVPLEISFSDDGIAFRPVHRRDEVFGEGGAPLRWSPDGREVARFVRLTARKVTCLHLDEVEVYGVPVSASAAEVAGGGMGQASALGSGGQAGGTLSDHHEVARADLLPSLPVGSIVPGEALGADEAMAPAATADQGLEVMGNEAPRELGEENAPRMPFWEDAVTSRPVGPSAARSARPAPSPAPEGFLAKLRRALFGE